MACKVQYLSSAGIHRREVAGVQALANAFPINWLLYCSLTAFPRHSAPIEIDVLLVMDDRIVLLELKDWNGNLISEGDNWFLNDCRRGRSPVVLGNEKAKKIKGIIKDNIPRLSKTFVDSRVVLTASASRDALPEFEKPYVLTLDEAKSLADPQERKNLLGSVTLSTIKPNMFAKEFDKLLGNSRYFEPLKKSWDGYVVTDEDFYLHRHGVWREHLAQLAKEERFKALLRLWRFDKLPAGLNEPIGRELVGDRELGVSAFLGERRSWLAERGILRPVGTHPDEVLTQHHQLLSIPNGWTTFRRYLERTGAQLSGEHRVDAMHTLVSMVAELHRNGVSHRDLGGDCVWTGSPTDMALTGFACAKLPDENSVSDWLNVLGTYAEREPDTAQNPTDMERDVRSLGILVQNIGRIGGDDDAMPPGWEEIAARATAPPGERYQDAIALADAIGELRNPSGPEVDQSRLDFFQTDDIPYVTWPPVSPPQTNGRCSRYRALMPDGGPCIVKVWNGMVRGDAQRDHAMLAMLEVASSMVAVPVRGVAPVIACGLSSVGPFLVTGFVEGVTLGELGQRSGPELLNVLTSLFASVTALHARGFAHGDLHPGQVIVNDDSRVHLIDVLDIPAAGAKLRSCRFAPPEYERRSDEQIDRFAACRMALDLCELGAPELEGICAALKAELARHVVETLAPVEEAIAIAHRKLATPPVREFGVSLPGVAGGALEADEGRLWVLRYESAGGVHSIFIQGLRHGLVLKLIDDTLDRHEVYEINFHQLGRGTPLQMSVILRPGEPAGVVELVDYVRASVDAVPQQSDESGRGEERDDAVGNVVDDELDAEEIREQSGALSEPPRLGQLDICRLWLRSAELEEDAVQTVTFGQRLADAGNSAVFRYTSSRPLEFDDENTVEVRLGRGLQGRKMGLLDIPRCDHRELAIRDLRGYLSEGEVFSLIDKRDRISKERRRRAVDRITNRKGLIPNLIDFFDPDEQIATQTFEVRITEEELKAYGLNEGQRNAFRTLLERGPVGLLQGPPGSGKTRFIAAFVHWLLTKGGARRILVASQSHEAVNNVLEELLRTYRAHGGHADLLRVGSRGATERIRPYQARSLRDRYRLRFENGIRTRVATVASAAGIQREFSHDVVEVQRRLGTLATQIELARETANVPEATPDDLRRTANRVRSLSRSFSEIAEEMLGRPVDVEAEGATVLVEKAYQGLLEKHSRASPNDVVKVRQILALALDWLDTLRSGHRNFDEFLAKTRSVVAGTCVGLGQSQIRLDSGAFDWVIVDEAARCTHGELAVPLQVGSRVVLVGDQRQLRPMVDREVVSGLREELPGVRLSEIRRSDFERSFLSSYGRSNARVLDVQYRMTPVISDLVSSIFYAPHGVQLRPSEDREPDEAFSNLQGLLQPKVVWFDTASAPGSAEQALNDGRDFWNEAEVEGVMSFLELLAAESPLADKLAGQAHPGIGVICMYSEQKRQMERAWFQRHFPDKFRRTVTIDTVDAYQGKENAIVILTLVRANSELNAGHVSQENRCNVAMSRARERLYIFGNTRMWANQRCASPMAKVLKHVARLEPEEGRVADFREIR